MEWMLEGNQRFVRSKKWRKERTPLVEGQNPTVIVVCCSDSRVPPEIVFHQIKLGEIFVVRTAGHVLDAGAKESIRFALDHLHCDSIIVLGHQNCGAVTTIYDKSLLCHKGAGCDSCTLKDNLCQPRLPYPRIEKYIGKSLYHDVDNTREENIKVSIKRNALRTAKLIIKDTGINPQHVYPAYYNIKSGHVDLL